MDQVAETKTLSTQRIASTVESFAPVLLPVLLFLVLQPETYGIAPNGLDPFFYTGFGINFDDSIAAGGDAHYFVSRWAVYYPLFIANALAGPFLGRILLRLIIVSLILRGVWKLRPEWSIPQRLVVGTVIASLPMFLRALFTDYAEYAVATFVFGLVIIAVKDRQTIATAFLSGLLAGLTVVSNPIGVFAVAVPLTVFILNGTKGWANKIMYSAVIIGTALGVLAFGLFYFRWVHGIDNLYQPTIDFIRTFEGVDPLKSPRLEWLGFFTWLYAPPVLIATVLGLAVRRTFRFDRMEWAAFTICAGQYVLQWIDQFVRNGNGLEISYYWSMSYHSLAVALALLLGRMVEGINLKQALGAIAAWCLLLIVGVPNSLRLPSSLGFALLASIIVLTIVIGAKFKPALGGAVLVGFIVWSQIGAPNYDPSVYHRFTNNPLYDRLFWSDGDFTDSLYQETVWFEDQMDTLPNDDQSFYIPVSGLASPIFGIYQAHVTGRLVALDETLAIEDQLLQAMQNVGLPLITFLGPPEEVEEAITNVSEQFEIAPLRVLDVTNESDLGYRIVVLELPPFNRFPEVHEANELPIAQGRVEASDVVVDLGSPFGFATYGPYLPLDPGDYSATLHYSATSQPDVLIGQFDVFTTTRGQLSVTDLPGTDGRPTQITLPFSVSGEERWEFRTQITGSGSGLFVVDKIVIEQE